LRAEATRERVIDRLHAELQEYKQDFLLKVQRPIFIDLIQLHDDIGKMIETRPASDAGPEPNQAVRVVIESIQTAIEDILYRQGVEPFAIEGDDFDARKQRAVSTQVTDDPWLNKKVASRLRKGFQAGDKLIRPEVVTVFTVRLAQPSTEA
jgi:molecular chaperone GrpE